MQPITKSNLKPKLILVSVALALAGCSVFPQLATKQEVTTRVKEDVAQMYVNQEPITAPITLEGAVARTLKYNLDYRLKRMESALALGIADYSKFDMWPKLLVNAGYNTRSNDSGGTSVGIEDGVQSLRASTSQERNYAQAGAEFSWNVLDFGVSYYRAKQNADQFLIAEERRRKLVQNMMQDVRAAYWRALGAQRLTADAKDILVRADKALMRSREAETQKIISPALALNYQRALLDATSLLNQRRQDLEFAKRELGALMSVPPGQTFTLAEGTEMKLPPAPNDVAALEEMALLQRPELREEDFKKRITAAETKKQILSFMPNLNVAAGARYDTNDFLYNNGWQQASVGVTWNLLKLFSLPALEKTQKEQVKVDEARRLALSMAILTQLRVSVERYNLALEDYKLADTAANVDKRLADYTKASVSAKLESELEAIRTQARSVLGAYQRANTYANAQIAFGRLYNTLGFDPLEDNFDHNSIAELSARVKQHLQETEQDSLKMKSNLFGNQTKVSVNVEGIQDAHLQKQMKEKLVALLARNKIVNDEVNGLPLTFSLKRDTTLAIEKASWSINLSDKLGVVKQSTAYMTKVPEKSRDSIMEATLIAAASSSLTTMKTWLAQLDDAANAKVGTNK
ncbi:MAG: TolC family protein [Methylotenera sp.]